MSISLNLKALLTKLATTQQTPTPCSSSFRACLKVLDKKSLRTQQSRHMTKWRKRRSALLPLNASSTPCTNNCLGMPLLDPTSKQTGKCEGNVFKAIRTNNLKDKVLARPPFNSTTMPKAWNNQPVPMDLDWTRAPRGNWRGQGRGSQRGNVAQVEDARIQRGIQGACFNCREQGHFTHNCPTKQKCTNTHTAQLINWSPEDNESESRTMVVKSIYQQLNVLPKEDQEELMTRMGAQEGNFSEA